VELTLKGREFIREDPRDKAGAQPGLLARLGSEDFDALRAILEKLLAE
jgi:DNA-binding MarR family transcriptional regulator